MNFFYGVPAFDEAGATFASSLFARPFAALRSAPMGHWLPSLTHLTLNPFRAVYMLCATTAIVLRCVNYGETSVIFDIYTPQEGFLSCIAHGVRKPKARIHANLLKPLSILDLVLHLGKDQKLSKVKEARLHRHYQELLFDVRKGAVGFFIAEVTQKCLRSSDPNPDLYHFLEETLLFLDQTKAPLNNIALWFLVHMSKALGFFPDLEQTLSQSDFFDYNLIKAAVEKPLHPYFWQADDVLMLATCAVEELVVIAHLELEPAQRSHLLKEMLKFYQFNLNNFRELKSLSILYQIFN